jgi:DNA-binding transcriptional LysR family regulator
MEFNDAGLFARVVEAGSFTRAATETGMTKSGVSRAIKRLEEDLGVRLLQRTTRKLSLTGAGRAYFDRVRGALAIMTEAAESVSEMGHEPRGLVRMTSPPDLAIVLMPIIAGFAREYPGIRVEWSLSVRVADLVEEGFDLAVRVGHLKDSSLIATRVGLQTPGLFASRDYVRRRGRPAVPAELEGHDFVLFRTRGGGQNWRDSLTLRDGHSEHTIAVHGLLEVDEVMTIRHAVVAGMGIGPVPLSFDTRRDALVRILPGWTLPGIPVSVVSVSRRLEPARVVLFRDYLATRLSRVRWRG